MGRRLDIRHLGAVTVAGTFALILLGIYTAAEGAGLACEARWPLCDGWMGLFPANWPSFVEWFHRLVAMLVGFAILATWFVSWRRGDSRRARWALTVAVLVLPVQIYLGAETVLSYESLYLIAHFLTALVIFTGILLGVIWLLAWEGITRSRAWRLLVGSLIALVPFFALKPGLFVAHSPVVQQLYYGLGLLLFATAVVLTVSPPLQGPTRTVPVLTGVAAGLVGIQLIAGRLVRTDPVIVIDWVSAAALVVVLGVALVWLWRPSRSVGTVAETPAE